MATLVLSTVGRVFGGTIGQAIGATIGQVIDREVLFKPKGREGPRLTELAVQTSSYGTPVPLIFGTMRVAGCVIWSTDLIESRSTSRSGKGQPSVTNYSYAASFAVALSGRAIARVGRIWADGKLLRGAAGDFKTATGFRLHPGDEDQAVDPLIAGAEGGMAPAHRGMAYAVFENFQLGEYGNRIPSLTFEVIGDAGSVAVGGIAAVLDGGVVTDGGVSLPLAGFAAYGDARSVLEMLAAVAGGRFVAVGGGVRMVDGIVAEATVADGGFAAGAAGSGLAERSIAAIEGVPRRLTIAHYDPARDYQTGLQRARRPGAGTREDRIDLPAAIGADGAKTIAEAALHRAEAARETRTVRLGWGDLGVLPGACIAIAGTPGVWRVSGWTLEHMVLTLECVALAGATVPATASAGRVAAAVDLVAGATILHAFELPPLSNQVLAAPRLSIAATGAGAGWRQAALLYSTDRGTRWASAGATAAPATIGVVASAPGPGPVGLFDLVSSLEVELAREDMALAGADDGALDGGANLALVGDELIQFGIATQLSARRWRLSRLLRGRRGTEGAIGGPGAGSRFVLIEDDALVTVDLPLASIGATVGVIASGVGDVAGPVAVDAAVKGASVLPPAPVHARAEEIGGGDLRVSWVRRSRAGWRWIDAVDAPLGEERELYRVALLSGADVVRTVEVSLATLTLNAADRVGVTRVEVRQVGSCGASPAAVIDINTI